MPSLLRGRHGPSQGRDPGSTAMDLIPQRLHELHTCDLWDETVWGLEVTETLSPRKTASCILIISVSRFSVACFLSCLVSCSQSSGLTPFRSLLLHLFLAACARANPGSVPLGYFLLWVFFYLLYYTADCPHIHGLSALLSVPVFLAPTLRLLIWVVPKMDRYMERGEEYRLEDMFMST